MEKTSWGKRAFRVAAGAALVVGGVALITEGIHCAVENTGALDA